MVNPNSDNGFPVLGKWNSPGAAYRCMGLAVSVRAELEKSRDVAQWKRDQEEGRPWLVAVRGKAKADYYSREKVSSARMRFYNAFPRQILLNMQVATQVLESSGQSILASTESCTGIGMTLTRGGAADLVAELDRRLARDGHAFVHVGDDSWVVMRDRGQIVMFALDCSNFDLTQHGSVTGAIHDEYRRQLAMIDRVAADLWHAYARERVVVVAGGLTYKWKHGGPSGMPLQSKVNDALMDVMIRRAMRMCVSGSEPDVEVAIGEAARSMGFSVRLEQYCRVEASTLKAALEVHPFLFIGYYFHTRDGQVSVFCDVARTFAQIPFPTLGWQQSKSQLVIREAMRLGSISMNLGIPPAYLDSAFDTFRSAARNLVAVSLRVSGDVEDPRLRWAVQENPLASEVQPSLAGLAKAMDRGPIGLWSERLNPFKNVSSTYWADMAEEEDELAANLSGGSALRPANLIVRGVPLPPLRVTTHPATAQNHGRPPPTAVWAPDKPPRQRELRVRTRRDRRPDSEQWDSDEESAYSFVAYESEYDRAYAQEDSDSVTSQEVRDFERELARFG